MPRVCSNLLKALPMISCNPRAKGNRGLRSVRALHFRELDTQHLRSIRTAACTEQSTWCMGEVLAFHSSMCRAPSASISSITATVRSKQA